MTLGFEQARECVLREVKSLGAIEQMPSLDAAGRVLAAQIAADRDYPPFARSARDGFALRAAATPGELRIIGEVRAGEVFSGSVQSRDAVEIMTGAPLPEGADAVIMIEHIRRDGDRLIIDRAVKAGDNFNPRGIEARFGDIVLEAGRRLGYAEIALAAMVGRQDLSVYRQPRVAIVPTGDEIVEAAVAPREFQIRNSNAWSLAVQVPEASGAPGILPIARDNYESTRALIERGLGADLLLLSGRSVGG